MNPLTCTPMPSRIERRADGVVQGVNLVLAIAGCAALPALAGPLADPARGVALAVYAAGLLAMATCSALYGWGRYSPRGGLYRHLDRAAIFLMIAGTYTPFLVMFDRGGSERRLLAAVWAIAFAGIVLMACAPRRFERLSVPLYLALGWIILSGPGLLARLPAPAAWLLVAGGLSYTVGVAFHRARIAFQEAIWHGFVVVGAACHYGAVVAAAAASGAP